MKFIFAAVLLAYASQSAQALKPASKKELKELNEIFVTIKDIGELIAENRADYDNASPKEKVDLNQKYLGLKEKREAPCRQALWLTIKAYDLLPFEGDRPILPQGVSSLRSPEIGTTITWVPVFEEKIPYDLQDAVGNIAFRNVHLINAAGIMASDGVSRIFPEAFTSPAALASLIYHERIHFKQFTAPSPNMMTPAEREVAAYSAQKNVWRKNLLGMTPDELEIEAEYLKENLEIHEAKAAVQRAKVRKAKGLPIDESSIVSHSEDDIARLIQQAKNQIVIAKRDHDERLKREWTALGRRSCDSAGSVSQGELDALPRLHKREIADNVKLMTGTCYDRAYWLLYTGGDAEALNKLSKPISVVNPYPRLVPRPVEVVVRTTFASKLEDLKMYAEIACKYQGRIALDKNLFVPSLPYLFSPKDEAAASSLMAGLGRCESHVFRRLFTVLQDERGHQITGQWLIDTVNSTPAAPVIVAPPQGGGGYVPPPPVGTNPCERNGNPFGCQQPHQ